MTPRTLSRPSSRPRPWRAAALYTLVGLLLTWPTVASFATHVPGDGIDDPALAWNLWWIFSRLVEQLNPDIFHVGWMFHPIDINLAFYTLTPLNGLLSVPLQAGLSPVPSINLVLLSSFVLGGFGAYLLVLELLAGLPDRSRPQSPGHVDEIVALLMGLFYAFASAKLFYVGLGQFNIASSQWIPFCVLYLVRLGHTPSARNGALAALFLVLQAWSELTYASFLIIFAALYFAAQMVTGDSGLGLFAGRRSAGRRTALRGMLLVAALFVVGILPFLWAMIPDMVREGDFFGSGGGFADIFSADLMGYLVPTRLHPLFGEWTAGLPFPNDKGQHIYIGYTVMFLAILGVLELIRQSDRAARRQGWFWLISLLWFWSLTLGPSLRWAGQPLPIPGPFALISRLPFFSGNRYPSRYSVLLLISVAVLAAYGLRRLLAHKRSLRLRRPLFIVLLAGLMIFEHLSVPLPLNDFRIPPIYAEIQADGDGVLLELPTGWRNGARVVGRADSLIMMQQWYQTAHGLRRLGGNTSRNPAAKFQYFSEAPLLGDMIGVMNADRDHIGALLDQELDAMIERDRALAPWVLNSLGIESVMVHVGQATPELLRFVDEALPLTLQREWSGPDWRGEGSTMRLYQVESTLPATWSVDLASAAGKLHLAEGWSALAAADGVRHATRARVDLLLPLPTAGGRGRLTVAGPATELQLSLHGRQLARSPIDPQAGETVVEFVVPAGLATDPVDRLQLHFRGTAVAVSTMAATMTTERWPIGETGFSLPADRPLVVRSAGEEVGDFARIFVAGQDVAPNQRGYNLAALAADGTLLDVAVFDPLGAPEASGQLAAWVAGWPEGTIIAGAVADEASTNLGQVAVDALAGLGVTTDLRGRFRWSHAFVGAVGAPAGTALEAADLIAPASVYVGLAVDGSHVYGAVGDLEFSAN